MNDDDTDPREYEDMASRTLTYSNEGNVQTTITTTTTTTTATTTTGATTTTATSVNGLRPGWIFGCVFVWVSITSGRFLAPFLEQEIGMSPKTIGICLCMQAIIGTAGGSLIGPWADRRETQFPGRGRTEIMAVGIMVGTICSLFHSLPHYLASSWSTFSNSSESKLLEGGGGGGSVGEASKTAMMATSSFPWIWYHFALRMAYSCCYCCIFPVIDAVTLQYLEQHPQLSKEDYGRERLYGAIGWAITHIIYAIMIDRWGFGVTYPLTLVSVVIALGSLHVYTQKQIHFAQRFLRKRNSDIVADQDTIVSSTEPPQLSMSWILRFFFDTYYSSAFMVCLFILSFGQVTVDALVFLFFETLDSSYTMMGITVIFTVAFEIPIFQVAPILLERTNAGILLLVASVSYIVRVLGYAAIPQGHIAYVLVLEPLHGVTYACAQTSSVNIASRISPVGWEATSQGLISLVKGLGSILGLLYGGWAVQYFGGRTMYEINSCLVSFGVLCLGLVSCWQKPPATHIATALSQSKVQESKYSGLRLLDDEEGVTEADSLEAFVMDGSHDESPSELELQPLGQDK